MLVTARLRYAADGEWGSRRYLDVTILDEWPYRMAGLWGCLKACKNLDGTTWDVTQRHAYPGNLGATMFSQLYKRFDKLDQ